VLIVIFLSSKGRRPLDIDVVVMPYYSVLISKQYMVDCIKIVIETAYKSVCDFPNAKY